MAEICFTGIHCPATPAVDDSLRTPTECKGGALGTIAGIAVSIAVPFVAPAVAGAIFGTSIMASLGGFGGILATAGTGAVLGGVGAALTGNDWATGALFGGLGAGAVQGFGGFGSTNAPLFGAPVTGAGAAYSGGLLNMGAPPGVAAPVAAPAAGLSTAASSATSMVPGLGATSTLGAAAGPQAGLGAFEVPWDKLTNAALQAAPAALSGLGAELMPPSEEALAAEASAAESLRQQGEVYNTAVNDARNINPEYYAQNAANAARIRVATAAAEGARTPGLFDPGRAAAETRRAAVTASGASGTAYSNAYLEALGAQRGAMASTSALRPDMQGNSDYLASYGVDAEREKRAEEMAKWMTPFSMAFTNSTNDAQVQAG